MPQQNYISLNFTDEEKTRIDEAIQSLKDTLFPKLKALNPEEKREMPIMGDKTVAFVQKALEYCKANPEFAPQFLDAEEFGSDLEAVGLMRAFYSPLFQIVDALSDTIALAGSDAYAAALVLYNSVKYTRKSNVPKADVIYEDLSARFPGRSKKSDASPV